MYDLDPLGHFHSTEISSMSSGIYLSMQKYIQDILSRVALTNHYIVDTPMELCVHLWPANDEPFDNTTHYYHIVKSVFQYLIGTISRSLLFPCSMSIQLQAYSDAAYASDHSGHRFLLTYCVSLLSSLIS
jgi:hypothetical protein